MVGPDLINQVRAALERDPDIDLHHYPIEVSHRGELCLEGEVENIVAKRRAPRIAREVAGSAEVHDHLRVHRETKRDGDGLRAEVITALMEEPVFRGFHIVDQDEQPPEGPEKNWIQVQAAQGSSEVILKGQVWSISHRRLAEVITWWIPGTMDVHNAIQVQPEENDTDAEITDAVRLVLEKDPSFDAEQISINTRDGVVTLAGAVSSDENRRVATYDCWYIPGVHDVRNELEVREHLRNS